MGDGTKKVLFISEMAQLKGIFLILYAAVRLKYAAVMVHVGPVNIAILIKNPFDDGFEAYIQRRKGTLSCLKDQFGQIRRASDGDFETDKL